jgi:hypothetical protein
MSGLFVIDHWREVVFDDAGQRRVYDRGTGAVSLCDLGIDGTLYCYGSRERMEKMCRDLTEECFGAEWRLVPLPWAGEAPEGKSQ